jgi:hypothetical protein
MRRIMAVSVLDGFRLGLIIEWATLHRDELFRK